MDKKVDEETTKDDKNEDEDGRERVDAGGFRGRGRGRGRRGRGGRGGQNGARNDNE